MEYMYMYVLLNARLVYREQTHTLTLAYPILQIYQRSKMSNHSPQFRLQTLQLLQLECTSFVSCYTGGHHGSSGYIYIRRLRLTRYIHVIFSSTYESTNIECDVKTVLIFLVASSCLVSVEAIN